MGDEAPSPTGRSLRTLLPAPGAFWTFNREERNAVAMLLGLLTWPGNFEAFCDLLDWRPADRADAEVAMEWTYLRDLWNHHSGSDSNEVFRSAILEHLDPPDRAALAACSVLDFNANFGAVPQPSAVYVQSPSNWSIGRFHEHMPSNEAFLRACRFKWAFNIKPDLVAQTPAGHVLCIEAKWDSREGRYPANEAEKATFRNRGLPYVTQTDIQRYLVEELLGFQGTFVYLARTRFSTDAGRSITWGEVLPKLDRSGAPHFVQAWCAKEIEASAP